MTKSLLTFSAFCLTVLIGVFTYVNTPPNTAALPTYPDAVQISDTTKGSARLFAREWVFQTSASVEAVRTFYLDRLAKDRWQGGDANSFNSEPLQYYWRSNSNPGSLYDLTITLTAAAEGTVIRARLLKQPYPGY